MTARRAAAVLRQDGIVATVVGDRLRVTTDDLNGDVHALAARALRAHGFRCVAEGIAGTGWYVRVTP